MRRPFLIPLFLLLFAACSSQPQKTAQQFQADHSKIRYTGRVDQRNPKEPLLVGAASTVELSFSGDSCQLLLRKMNPAGEHNWVSLELDGEYLGRFKLAKEEGELIPVKASQKKETHLLKIYKATEAQNGQIAFMGVKAQNLHPLPALPTRSIEFIGNSITCGMGIEWKEVACDSGLWYDQHNAYKAYGPKVARELGANFMLSSVSGMGMYRNWNNLAPVMPQVYQKLYLDTLHEQAWNFGRYTPDLVSIALGTNDFSEGDGVNARLPFDSAKFVSAYIGFVDQVYSHYPNTQICLLTSPMVSGENGKLFLRCLQVVEQHFRQQSPNQKPIRIYEFKSIEPGGCSYHPDEADHQEMTNVLLPFYREVMGW